MVHLISIYTFIDSLRYISHHHIICTHDHLLVDQRLPMMTLSQSRTFKTIRSSNYNIVLFSCYVGQFDQRFHLNREGLE